jgi:2-oxoglutarate dehydrogenase E2 component (dihydrolipoamide succinyltransferase)
MIIEVKVPSVGESVTSGVVSAWHKKSGEFVNEGEPLFALETDKVSTDIVAEKSGVLETKVSEGQEVKIGEVIAVIDDSKQTAQPTKEEKPKKEEPQEKKKITEPEKKPAAAGVDRGQPESASTATTLSPGVRRIVEEEKLEPQEIAGTGPGGRLTKADAMKALEARGKAKEKIEARESQPPADMSAGASAKGETRFTRKKMSPLRRKIAQQLVMAQHTAAILTTFNECDMSTVQ